MSHVERMELDIKDISAMKKACEDLNCIFIEGQKTYKWWGSHVGDYPLPEGMTKEEMGHCEHAIKVPGTNWEIGLVKDKENPKTHKLIYDFYGSEGKKIEKVCGEKLGKLKQRYTVNALKNKIKNKMKIKEEQVGNKVKLTISIP